MSLLPRAHQASCFTSFLGWRCCGAAHEMHAGPCLLPARCPAPNARAPMRVELAAVPGQARGAACKACRPRTVTNSALPSRSSNTL